MLLCRYLCTTPSIITGPRGDCVTGIWSEIEAGYHSTRVIGSNPLALNENPRSINWPGVAWPSQAEVELEGPAFMQNISHTIRTGFGITIDYGFPAENLPSCLLAIQSYYLRLVF